jgi:hypothetical protein
MKTKLLRGFFLALVIFTALAGSGCASHKPKSSVQTIMEGDPNPYITPHVEHAGEHVTYR